MHQSTLLTYSLFSSLFSLNAPFVSATDAFNAALIQPKAAQAPSPNDVAHPDNVIELSRSPGSLSSRYTQALANGNGKDEVDGTYGTADLKAVEGGLVYSTPIEIGGEKFTLVIDTGSSDTWVAGTEFVCTKGSGQASCKFGATYNQSSTFTPIDNENFEISYSDGEYLNGIFGKDQVKLAGITVKDQQIAVVESANWIGDGNTAGVVGLAFPANTRAFTGKDYSQDSVQNQITYSPLFTSMYNEGSVPPLFSLALNRDGTGKLAIGGTPDVDYVPVFASSPFQLLTASGAASGKTQYTFYTITTGGFEYKSAQDNWDIGNWLTYFGNPNDATQVQVLIDSGTTVNYLPQAIAEKVNNLFTPAATFNGQNGYYNVACDAKAPQFGVKIGQETFYINPQDMIIRTTPNTCISGVTATGPGGNSILGHAFLKNVLAIFDVGASEMRFAAREYS